MSEDAETTPRDYSAILNKLERVYLGAIRAIALLVATVLLFFAAWLAVSGVYKISRDTNSVTEGKASVAPKEITDVNLKTVATAKNQSGPVDPLEAERKFYVDFQAKYHALFKARFESYRHTDDPSLSAPDFGERFLNVASRLDQVENGSLDFAQDKNDLDTMLAAMTEAASAKPTLDRLQRYKRTKKQSVSRTVSSSRSERYCSYYDDYFGGCLLYDTRRVPTKRTVTELQVPEGTVSHIDLFAAYHDRYFSLLDQRRKNHAVDADSARNDIIADNINGGKRLLQAAYVVGAFMALMFLFLLIAMERHQRHLARVPDPSGDRLAE